MKNKSYKLKGWIKIKLKKIYNFINYLKKINNRDQI
jgi:hypothetical protein